MEGWMWLVLASMFAVGGLLGYVLGRSKGDNHHKIRELETSLRDSKAELNDYRNEVVQHFGKTADLFNQLTTDYRQVYEHLAASSEALCGDQVAKISAKVPDKKLLDSESDKPPVESASVDEVATAGAEEPQQEAIVENKTASDQVGSEETKDEKTSEVEATPVKEKTPEEAARTIH